MLKTSSNRKKKIGNRTKSKKTIEIGIGIGLCIVLIVAVASYFIFMHHRHASHKIVEAKTILDVYKYIKPDEFNAKTLVVFDIDNTLVYPKTLIGSEQWFYAMVSKFESEGMTTEEAVNATLPQSFEIL